jgi:hypothetical protein
MKSNGWLVYPIVAVNVALMLWSLLGKPSGEAYILSLLMMVGLSIALLASNAPGDRTKGVVAIASGFLAVVCFRLGGHWL